MTYRSRLMLGVYVHIPHCVQLCGYCDFARYQLGKIPSPEAYFELLKTEIQNKASFFSGRQLESVYFGGGTPSLMPPKFILAVLRELEKAGMAIRTGAEITLEVDPNAISREVLNEFLSTGVNRVSLGIQTFNESFLTKLGRRHTAEEAHRTLGWVRETGVAFSMDLLFALPDQSLEALELDLKHFLSYEPNHLSPYCLTLSPQHALSRNRPTDEIQREMFFLVDRSLSENGYQRYEVSNYARPGFESRHNHLYWNEDEYWGIGLSAHSHLKVGPWGSRFWNPSGWQGYCDYIEQLRERGTVESPWLGLPEKNRERLEFHQALTDFCHVRLRRAEGFSQADFEMRFAKSGGSEKVLASWGLVEKRLHKLKNRGLLEHAAPGAWKLTQEGWLLSNLVFEELTFLRDEVAAPAN